MVEKNFVSLPVNFNCWKHHAGFIKEQIKKINSENDLKNLTSSLLKIGESQMDLYLGKLTPEEISGRLLNSLKKKKLFSPEQYYRWLCKDGRDYRLVKLKDKSIWALRFGEDPERFIHIHPGRYSPHTVRVKATSLKTAILALSLKKLGTLESIDTDSANKIRKKFLNEPPLKSLSKAPALIRLLDLFSRKS